MARTAGSRNRDYEQKRGLILVALQKRLRGPTRLGCPSTRWPTPPT